jgi:hypothetical protein
MFRPLFAEDSLLQLERNYQSWVMKSLCRSSSLRKTLARAIGGSESSSWPTATSFDGSHQIGRRPNQDQQSLTVEVTNWPTPRAEEYKEPVCSETAKAKGFRALCEEASQWGTPSAHDRTQTPREVDHGIQLANQASLWPTPKASSGGADPEDCEGHQGGLNLKAMVTQWPTPQVGTGPASHSQISGDFRNRMEKILTREQWTTPTAGERSNRGNRFSDNESSNRGGQANLADDTQLWHTPSGSAAGQISRSGDRINEPLLDGQVKAFRSSLLVPVISTDGIELSPTDQSTSERRRLNPAFVCWLMGCPWWWTQAEPTNCAALAMVAFRLKLRSLLSRCFPNYSSHTIATKGPRR